MRNSFILYTEYYQHFLLLSLEEQGILINAIFKYEMGQELPQMNMAVKMAFSFIKLRLDKDNAKSKKGENHWNWKGGISNENHFIRNCTQYKDWRNEVFKRDKYTCRICGRKGVKLNAHHIEKFSKNKEKRFDIDNGITLCENCHKELHKNER